jgi:hypothetical protein
VKKIIDVFNREWCICHSGIVGGDKPSEDCVHIHLANERGTGLYVKYEDVPNLLAALAKAYADISEQRGFSQGVKYQPEHPH